MEFHNEWDTVMSWAAPYVHEMPLQGWRHVMFGVSLFFLWLSTRFIIQHRVLQRWLLFHLSGRNRSARGQQLRRMLAEIGWHFLGFVFYVYFKPHPQLYLWITFTKVYLWMDLLWLLQYRRFYRNLDYNPIIHTSACLHRILLLISLQFAQQYDTVTSYLLLVETNMILHPFYNLIALAWMEWNRRDVAVPSGPRRRSPPTR